MKRHILTIFFLAALVCVTSCKKSPADEEEFQSEQEQQAHKLKGNSGEYNSEPTFCTVVIDGDTMVVNQGDKITLPELQSLDENTAMMYKIGDKMYNGGDSLNVTDDFNTTAKRYYILNCPHSITEYAEFPDDSIITLPQIASPNHFFIDGEPRNEGEQVKITDTTNIAFGITITVEGESFNMMYVEHGSFMMGCDTCSAATAKISGDLAPQYVSPAHKVTLTKDFYLAQKCVTNNLWTTIGMSEINTKYDPNYASHVLWDSTQSFIAKINSATGLSFRLPTEAEWEYAARGGKMLKHNSFRTSSPNELGLYYPNRFEWVNDLFSYYTSDSLIDPTGPTMPIKTYGHIDRRYVYGRNESGQTLYDLKINYSTNTFTYNSSEAFEQTFRLALTIE